MEFLSFSLSVGEAFVGLLAVITHSSSDANEMSCISIGCSRFWAAASQSTVLRWAVSLLESWSLCTDTSGALDG